MSLLPQPCIASQAVVLRTWPSGETSVIASLLTEAEGYVRVIGKGARKQRSALGPLLHPGRLVQLEFSLAPDRQLQYLRGGSLVLDPLLAAASLEKSAYLLASVELVDRCRPTGQREARLFALCHDFLRVLSCAPVAGEAAAFYAFELALLQLQGTAPELSGCCECGTDMVELAEVALWFDPACGGVVCRGCHAAGNQTGGRSLAERIRATLAAFADVEFCGWTPPVLPRDEAREIGILLHHFLAYHLPEYRLPAALDLLRLNRAPGSAGPRPGQTGEDHDR